MEKGDIRRVQTLNLPKNKRQPDIGNLISFEGYTSLECIDAAFKIVKVGFYLYSEWEEADFPQEPVQDAKAFISKIKHKLVFTLKHNLHCNEIDVQYSQVPSISKMTFKMELFARKKYKELEQYVQVIQAHFFGNDKKRKRDHEIVIKGKKMRKT